MVWISCTCHPLSHSYTHTLRRWFSTLASHRLPEKKNQHFSHTHTHTLSIIHQHCLPLTSPETISQASSIENVCPTHELHRKETLYGASRTISHRFFMSTAGFHDVLHTLWRQPHQKVPSLLNSEISGSRNGILDWAPHHKVSRNVKPNAPRWQMLDLMGCANGDRVRCIKYDIPCNAAAWHTKYDTWWCFCCTAVAVFRQRTIGRNLKGSAIKALPWLYGKQCALVYVTLVQSTMLHTHGRTDGRVDRWMDGRTTYTLTSYTVGHSSARKTRRGIVVVGPM